MVSLSNMVSLGNIVQVELHLKTLACACGGYLV